MWERRLEAEGAPEGLAFFPFLWREPRAFRGGETQCNCTLKKKKKEAAGRFGGESWEFKVNSESFLFFFLSFFFFLKAVKYCERISGSISPPSQSPLQEF